MIDFRRPAAGTAPRPVPFVLAGKSPVVVHNCGDNVYVPGGKHGKVVRNSSRGVNSREPTNGQAALDNSVPVRGTSTHRIGVDVENGEIVVLDNTNRRIVCSCGEGDGPNDSWHGHVRDWDDLHIDQPNALKRAGLVDKRGRII
ncbi:hypothetical protein AB0425_13260 [Actinosynnema sp. NPDC051121]|nr:hypothetical protein [Saccharothrix sp.]